MQYNTKDVMIDLETLGTKPGCGILAIGATTLDLQEHFYCKIAPESNKDLDLFMQQDTMDWHQKQPIHVYQENFSGTTHILEALEKFQNWFKQVQGNCVWGNGADFDLPILTAAYHETMYKVAPWKPFNGRCYRTLKSLYSNIKPDIFEGAKHTALADAIYQAKHLVKILDYMEA